MPPFQTVRGMRDLLAEEAEALTYVICKARETAQLYGYREVVTPLVENYDLLSAKSGEEISSRMFIFKDLGGREVALRPEFTASIARLTTTALRTEPKPIRVFSVGSVYRYDEPQRGRYREFWQSNFELVGSREPEADVEAILLTDTLMKATGLPAYTFKIGHIGVIRGILSQEDVGYKTQNAILQLMDKKEYDKALNLLERQNSRAALQGLLDLRGKTPQETAEKIRKYVKGYYAAEVAAQNLGDILQVTIASGCPIETVEPDFARGLEYYTGVIFEVNEPSIELALCGGGRYDKLIEVFGGESTPAVGVAHGLDRMILAMQMHKTDWLTYRKKTVVVIPVKQELKAEALKISQVLRDAGISVTFEIMGRKISKALEDADRRRADYAVIVGKRELKKGKVIVKDLLKHKQTTEEIEKLPKILAPDEAARNF